MSEPLRFALADEPVTNGLMTVVGIGGAGCNAINRMIQSGITDIKFVAINTDVQSLNQNLAPHKIQIGNKLTKGLGSGANPDIGRQAAEEDCKTIEEILLGSELVFITAGMGKGTGTGASPVVAEIAKNLNALTVAIVTLPFLFEGPLRSKVAESGVNALRSQVNTLIAIPNQRLLGVVEPNTSLRDAFLKADSVLMNATTGITNIVQKYGEWNLDFQDVKTVIQYGGDAIIGIGTASGEDRGKVAANLAITSPLLEDISIAGAQGVLLQITGAALNIQDIVAAGTAVREAVGENANILTGTGVDEELGDQIRVTLIATGFNKTKNTPPTPQPVKDKIPEIRTLTTRIDMEQPPKYRSSLDLEQIPPTRETPRKMFEVDLDGEPPSDFNVPAYLRKNGHH